MIYHALGSDDPVDQADIVAMCPISSPAQFHLEEVKRPRITVYPCCGLVLAQACDLANRKAPYVTVAVVDDAQSLVEQNLIKPTVVRGPIRSGSVFGWYYLPASARCGLPEMIVDLRPIHRVRLGFLTSLCQRGHRPARLLSPCRVHLAKHFVETFSRIGLAVPYETDS